jgi:hypothetical protein
MNKYNNGKIYKLICNESNLIYYGSTIQPLYKRLNDHRKSYLKFIKNEFHYLTAFEIIKNNNFNIVLVEEFSCENKEQLEARERYYIDNNKCVNKYKPTRTKKEYFEEHKEHLKNLNKQYYINNKNIIQQKSKEKYKNITEEQRENRNKKARENYKKRKDMIDNQYTKI